MTLTQFICWSKQNKVSRVECKVNDCKDVIPYQHPSHGLICSACFFLCGQFNPIILHKEESELCYSPTTT